MARTESRYSETPAVESNQLPHRQLALTPEVGYVIRNFCTAEIQFRFTFQLAPSNQQTKVER